MTDQHPQTTPDGRYLVVRGRLWRRADPRLPAGERARLTAELMAARRAKGAAMRAGDTAAREEARARVDAAKHALGERGPVWWDDGAPDLTRHLAWTGPYAAWWEEVSGPAPTLRAMPMSFQVAVDCHDPHVLAEWWAETLGWQVEPQDEAFIRSMVEQGHASDADTTTHRGALVWREGAAVVHPGPAPVPGGRLYFQLVPEDKVVKNRVHLDLRPAPGEQPPSVEDLVRRGATVVGEGRQGPHTWTVLTDPEGNEFCLSAVPDGADTAGS